MSLISVKKAAELLELESLIQFRHLQKDPTFPKPAGVDTSTRVKKLLYNEKEILEWFERIAKDRQELQKYITIKEIIEKLNRSKEFVFQLRNREDFPKPVKKINKKVYYCRQGFLKWLEFEKSKNKNIIKKEKQKQDNTVCAVDFISGKFDPKYKYEHF